MNQTRIHLKRSFRVAASAAVFGFLLCLPTSSPCDDSKPKISNPSRFKVRYSLNSKPTSGSIKGAPGLGAGSIASIAVNILDERFYPVKAYVVREVKSPDRAESLWDGRNVYGKEMPAGPYYASLSILYSDGSRESKFFRFVKE